MTQTTMATKRQIHFKNWLLALYTIPQFKEGEYVDPVTRWLIAMRASVLAMTVISGLLGGLLAAVAGKFDLGLLLWTTLGLTLAHAGSNLVNDFWDARHGMDTADSPRVNYSSQPFVNHEFSDRQLLIGTGIILAAAALIGVYLLTVSGPIVALFAVAGAAVLLFYSGDPFPLKYRGLGEIAVLIVWGPLMVGGTYYVITRELPLWVLAASLPYALGVTTVLLGKHLDKYDFDKRMHINTLVVLLGEKNARRLTLALVALMYVTALALVVAGVLLPTVLLVLLALPAVRWMWAVFSKPKPTEPPPDDPIWPLFFVGIAFLHNRRFGSFYLLGIVLDIAVRAFILKA
jgi:1,4-dihydroxy-2-naphthoate polyprenyltransferase